MATTQIGNILGVTAVAGKDINGGDDLLAGWNDGALQASTSSIRTRLAAFNGALYTTAYLDSLTFNDMVYALRLADAPATIK